ncbi:hypothetical protein [Acinetobacter sp. B51(2017)]|uniref:hypothetical protein n=1 Tax=Acinetobacter sp. B51(2017) TaxID=2060938 RepID=UPI000F08BD7D|nr:hypothetical protein [Acinetobacter sp. B51(2017)]
MQKFTGLALIVSVAVLLSACSTPVKPTYVSPTQYQALNCQQLQSEYNRISQYIANGVETPKRTGMGVGVGLGAGWGSRGGWGLAPNVSVNMGQSSNSKRSEEARLLGQQEAVVQAAKFKNCPIIIRNNVKK